MSFDNTILNSIYDRLIDDIINIPLQSFSGRINRDTGTSTETLTDAFTLNRSIVNNILDIRRGVQLQQQSVEVDVNNRHVDSLFFENVMDMFLDDLDITNFSTNMYGESNNNTYDDVKVILTEEEFNKLDVVKKSHEHCITCSICMGDFNEDTSTLLVSLPCRHVYHKNCIHNWLCKESVKCPICRHDCRELN